MSALRGAGFPACGFGRLSSRQRELAGAVERSDRNQRGVALIVTLIMLAVITFMATTFLVLSRRERNSVTTNTDQTTARFTADSALERAKARLLAGILSATNDQNFDLMVPTNFFNPYGFNTALVNYDPTNVNYGYLSSGGALNPAQQQQNIANLLYDPRPPVFITNTKVTNDFRYYLDLNRNGLFDDTGSISNVINVSGNLVTNGNISVVGDPQWIGVLRFPDRPHSADNPFEARWTYFVAPAGKTLDVNYLHNQAASKTVNPSTTLSAAADGFSRNQGAGTWEINLAAFLADLNTNVWNTITAPYNYRQADLPVAFPNTGTAFDDARALLSYRYSYNYGNLVTALQQFTSPQVQSLRTDNIDEYADGPLMYGTRITGEAGNNDDLSMPWAGADNPNHFFTTQDFFDRNKVGTFVPSFADRLMAASQLPDTYNRYTFYRMLAQLGTDSAPPVEDKININYCNVTNGVVVPGMETNLIAWTPLDFFTNSAARMFAQLNLRDNNNKLITVTNIPVWPLTNNNFYSPAVHRILQLAANIYEATTNSLYPCIYRPLFSAVGSPTITNVFISGYELVNGPDNLPTPPAFLTQVPVDLNNPVVPPAIAVTPLQSQRNIYGVPWIIGAKKGFPNLNQVAMQSVSQLTRKVLVYRPLTRNSWTGFQGKQMFVIGVSNELAVGIWNSYNTNYPRALYIQADGNLTVQITNNVGINIVTNFTLGSSLSGAINLPAGTLLGTGLRPPSGQASQQPNMGSFVVPLSTNMIALQDSVQVPGGMLPASDATFLWNQLPWNNLIDPQWAMNITTNNIRCFIMDGGPNGRVVDYVQLTRMDNVRNLTQETLDPKLNALGVWTQTTNISKYYWASPTAPISQGVVNQMQISQGSPQTSDQVWADNGIPLAGGTKAAAIANFFNFLTMDIATSNTIQAPFTPTAKMRQTLYWQANDPLVHYLQEDLTNTTVPNGPVVVPLTALNTIPTVLTNMYVLSQRYSPWGGYGPKTSWTEFNVDPHMYDAAIKDPLVVASDSWDFPTNKFPSVGWLGRVHRGTPWQTVYMKSANILNTDFQAWQTWSSTTANPLLATNIAPVMDRQLFEVFTTSLSDNAARGQLSINQTNLAAWSAVLSGVIVLTNDPVKLSFGPYVLSPVGIYDPTAPLPLPVPQFWPPPVWQIVQGINNTRTNYPGLTFTNLGDILSTPQFTDVSPYLITTNAAGNHKGFQSIYAGAISDEVMERIPQQIMSLLTISHNPRFVIYSYGQTLHPANNSIVTFGTYSGLCTNYQVTAETATRAVVHVEGAPKKPHVVIEQYNILPPD